MKIQYVDQIPRHLRGQVEKLLNSRNERDVLKEVCDALELNHLMSRDIDQLSGGELQRMAIAMTTVSKSDVYMYDEPSSYLDVKQRLRAAEVIRSVLNAKTGTYVIVVEHDLAVLDYLSDFVCVLYGRPGAYGVVTMPFNVRDGINIFLAGFVPTENLRFREIELSFKVAQTAEDTVIHGKRDAQYNYEAMTKTLQGKGHTFKLHVEAGNFSESEIIVMLGENGTGKTTFIRMLAGLMKCDEEEAGRASSIPALSVSYKPQTGLDFVRGADRAAQLSALRTQLRLARERGLPVVLHCVRAFEPLMRELAASEPRAVIFHGFIGSPEQARQALAKGYCLSFGERTFASVSYTHLTLPTT